MKKLILCADDFAVHEAASSAILQLAERGRISATSAMVLSPRWAQDAAGLKPLRGSIDVGLHLDWTSEFAKQEGHGCSLAGAMLKAAVGGFDKRAARQVIDDQLDRFEAHWQAAPDHVDGHQHVQQFAGIREALVEALSQRYPGRRPYLRRSKTLQTDFKSRIISAMGAEALGQLARACGIQASPLLSGVYDFSGDGALYAQRMTQWLSESPAGTIIMCHPAQQANAFDTIGRARVWEFNYLGGADFPLALAQAGVELVRGGSYNSSREHATD
ncbi:MAG: ChbG/HpnK family deacetylase [Burkholderiaceae bacterium]